MPEQSTIDLDECDDAQPGGTATRGGSPAQPQTVSRLVAVLAVGVVLGGVGVNGLRDARERQQRDSIVQLVVMPATNDGAHMESEGLAQMNGSLR